MARDPSKGAGRAESQGSRGASRRDAPRRQTDERDSSTAGKCRLCQASLRPSYNYCPNCSLPVDPAHDHPLFVVEGLTNLFNVVFFESLLEQELNRASRYGHEISLLVAEIDSLPELEAAFGYHETNRLVKAVGHTIASAIRDPDTIAATNRVAALGTQRFLVLLPETGEEGAFRAAEKIRRMVGSTIYHIEDGPVTVTASIGVASTVPNQQNAPNLLEHASQALIHSRQSGPNRIQVSLGAL